MIEATMKLRNRRRFEAYQKTIWIPCMRLRGGKISLWIYYASGQRKQALRKMEQNLGEPWRKLRMKGFDIIRVELIQPEEVNK